MNFELATGFISQRAKDLGYGNDYHIRLRYMMLVPGEKRFLEAYNQFIVVIDAGFDVRVESEMGAFDWNDTMLKDYLYEHSGFITVTNRSGVNNYCQYIHVIPKKKSDARN